MIITVDDPYVSDWHIKNQAIYQVTYRRNGVLYSESCVLSDLHRGLIKATINIPGLEIMNYKFGHMIGEAEYFDALSRTSDVALNLVRMDQMLFIISQGDEFANFVGAISPEEWDCINDFDRDEGEYYV